MLQKQIESFTKDFPSRVKEENAKLAGLSKALISLNKTHQNNAAQTSALIGTFGQIDQTKEFSNNFLQVYGQMQKGLQTVLDEQNLKETRIKEIAAKATKATQDNMEAQKDL